MCRASGRRCPHSYDNERDKARRAAVRGYRSALSDRAAHTHGEATATAVKQAPSAALAQVTAALGMDPAQVQPGMSLTSGRDAGACERAVQSVRVAMAADELAAKAAVSGLTSGEHAERDPERNTAEEDASLTAELSDPSLADLARHLRDGAESAADDDDWRDHMADMWEDEPPTPTAAQMRAADFRDSRGVHPLFPLGVSPGDEMPPLEQLIEDRPRLGQCELSAEQVAFFDADAADEARAVDRQNFVDLMLTMADENGKRRDDEQAEKDQETGEAESWRYEEFNAEQDSARAALESKPKDARARRKCFVQYTDGDGYAVTTNLQDATEATNAATRLTGITIDPINLPYDRRGLLAFGANAAHADRVQDVVTADVWKENYLGAAKGNEDRARELLTEDLRTFTRSAQYLTGAGDTATGVGSLDMLTEHLERADQRLSVDTSEAWADMHSQHGGQDYDRRTTEQDIEKLLPSPSSENPYAELDWDQIGGVYEPERVAASHIFDAASTLRGHKDVKLDAVVDEFVARAESARAMPTSTSAERAERLRVLSRLQRGIADLRDEFDPAQVVAEQVTEGHRVSDDQLPLFGDE